MRNHESIDVLNIPQIKYVFGEYVELYGIYT
jgi:hypothetical protein